MTSGGKGISEYLSRMTTYVVFDYLVFLAWTICWTTVDMTVI